MTIAREVILIDTQPDAWSVPRAKVDEVVQRGRLPLFALPGIIGAPTHAMPRVLVPLAEREGAYAIRPAYVRMLLGHGLYPELVSPVARFPAQLLHDAVRGSHGVLLTGGDDIAPAHYGAVAHERTLAREPGRDALEIALLQQYALPGRIPLFGVCRGLQVLAVASGGSLHQHVPEITALPHGQPGIADAQHPVALERGSRVQQALERDTFIANSAHHQSVDRVGAGLRIVGTTPDGIVEVVESEDPAHWCVAVQGHPERAKNRHLEPLLDAFAQAAARYRQERRI